MNIKAECVVEVENQASAGGDVSVTYTVTIVEHEHATVSSSHSRPRKGQKVTITVVPEESYALDYIRVENERTGEQIEVTDLGNNEFSFIMPNSPVNVYVSTSIIS